MAIDASLRPAQGKAPSGRARDFPGPGSVHPSPPIEPPDCTRNHGGNQPWRNQVGARKCVDLDFRFKESRFNIQGAKWRILISREQIADRIENPRSVVY